MFEFAAFLWEDSRDFSSKKMNLPELKAAACSLRDEINRARDCL